MPQCKPSVVKYESTLTDAVQEAAVVVWKRGRGLPILEEVEEEEEEEEESDHQPLS